jgi:hypothetical protein
MNNTRLFFKPRQYSFSAASDKEKQDGNYYDLWPNSNQAQHKIHHKRPTRFKRLSKSVPETDFSLSSAKSELDESIKAGKIE